MDQDSKKEYSSEKENQSTTNIAEESLYINNENQKKK